MSDGPLQSSTLRRNRELILFCRQLGAMLNAGTDILRALLIVQDQVSLPSLRSALETARNDMTLGMTLAFSLNRYPHLFSPFFIDMIRQGEGEGTLGDVLSNLSDYLEKETRMEPLTASPALALQPAGTPNTAASFPARPLRPPGPGYRMAVWMGLGTTAAAGVWGIAAASWSTAAGIVAGLAVLGLALAGWGVMEQLEMESSPNEASGAVPAAGGDSMPAFQTALPLPLELGAAEPEAEPGENRRQPTAEERPTRPHPEISPPPPPTSTPSAHRAARRNMPL